MTQQPTALRLADCLERDCEMNWPDYDNQMDAAAELRRLHEENERLKQEVQTEQALSFRKQVHTLEAALRQAVEALELEDLACRYEKDPTPEHIAKAITAAKQALEGRA